MLKKAIHTVAPTITGYPNIAFRIAPSYLGTTYGSKIQNSLGFEMGIVYRFGHQR